MSDGLDGSGQIPRRSPRVGDHASPVNGVLAIVLAAVAVIAGFLILRSITDDGDGTALGPVVDQEPDDSGSDTTAPVVSEAPVTPPSVTQPPFTVVGADVVVANANGQGGSAGNVGDLLASAAGFTVVDPVNAADSSGDLPTSAIFFDPTNVQAEAVANSLNRVLGGSVPVAAMPPEGPPTRDGALNEADVLLMLGDDFAAVTAAQLVLPNVAAESTTTVAGATTTTVAG